MRKILNTQSARETRELGRMLAKELRGGEILALSGDLGSGKTTFAQGLLRELGARGPVTSPTFIVMKQYDLSLRKNVSGIKFIYHIDAYRVKEKDFLNLGWQEIINDKSSIVVVEWADRIKKIIPPRAVWINFKLISENKREIIFRGK